ncbi:MAG: hypothetical protein IKQ31_01575 [Clostridia bacterium]|nr:hypothetical protein [Clostridia bacterium]
MEDVILPNLNMIDWDFNKKLAYLKQRKEFLYEVWNQKLQNTPATKFEKANKDAFYLFYNAFTGFAKVLLVGNYDECMPQVILLQRETEREMEDFLRMPQLLENHCKTHSKTLCETVTQLMNNNEAFNQHFVDRLNTIRMLYIHPNTNENRYLWLRIGFKCEALLLNQDSSFLTTAELRKYGDHFIKQFDEMLLPVRKFKNIESQEKNNTTIFDNHPKYYYMFQDLLTSHPEYEKYRDEYFEVSEKIRLWTMIFEDKRYTYYRHYDLFQRAVSTDIKLYNKTHNLPQPIVSSLFKYAVNRFEKLEVFKRISGSVLGEDLRVIMDNHKQYLLDWNKQIAEQCKKCDFSKAFKNDIISMYHLQASHLTKNSQECNWYMEKLYSSIDYTPNKNLFMPKFGNALSSKYSLTSQAFSLEK